MVEPAGYASRAGLSEIVSEISAVASRRSARPREEMSVTPVRPRRLTRKEAAFEQDARAQGQEGHAEGQRS
jgi:hypothetical protein